MSSEICHDWFEDEARDVAAATMGVFIVLGMHTYFEDRNYMMYAICARALEVQRDWKKESWLRDV